MDRTFIMIKPDGVQRGLIGEIIRRLESKGLKLIAIKLAILSEEQVREQYREHIEKPFFSSLREFIVSGPCLSMVWEGYDAVTIARRLIGATNPIDAAPGTIRGDLAIDTGRNVVHASDSPESAIREINIHFTPSELLKYQRIDEKIVYEWSD